MVTGKQATLVLVLSVLIILSQVQQLECRTGWTNSAQDAASTGDMESESTSKSWSSAARHFSQQRLLRALEGKRRTRQHDSWAIQDWIDQLSSKRVNAEVKAANNSVPAQQTLDLVKSLPGQPQVEFAQYAGYVTVNETIGRALFYYFVEASITPDTKPLVLWLNGGPGCSSLGFGAFSELGPFRVNSDGATLTANNYAWNREANILFLESPAGVGFSYSNNTKDYLNSGDTQTAADSLIFLLNWLERFPQYKNRHLFICGESYAGHYVPQLANMVYLYNKGTANTSGIAMKGIMVGNGVTDLQRDSLGTVDYLWTHALISNETYVPLHECLQSTNLDNCSFEAAYIEAGNIDPYNIYGPLCTQQTTSLVTESSNTDPSEPIYDPCFQSYVTTYFNRQDVQAAMHANVTKLPYTWGLCGIGADGGEWQDSATTVIPIYQELIAAGMRIYVFSGDVDSVVPVTATQYSLALLNLNITRSWSAWNTDDGEVGGYREQYDGLTFVTVHGSGHEVPLFQPYRAFIMFSAYITNAPLK